MVLKDLPPSVDRLLQVLNASTRLRAHLTLVHDVAVRICEKLKRRWPDLSLDIEAVAFGAATHDVGKTLHPNELTGPGKQHELAGAELLASQGVPAHLSRFARTHGSWRTEANVTLEDLLVALSDSAWKGKRDDELETRVATQIAALNHTPQWEAFSVLDGILQDICVHADQRLEWQRQH